MPSVSARAETVMTSLYAAGTNAAALVLSLAAAATTVMPPLYRRQIALCRTSLFVTPQFRSSRPDLRDAHVDGLDQRAAGVVRVALGEDPIETADVPGQQAIAVGVEDADGPHAGAGGDADDADRVVDGGDRAGHVGAVAVLVLPGRSVARRAVDAALDVEVGVRGDAGVHDGDVRVDALVVDGVDVGGRRQAGADARDAGRVHLGGDADDLVGDDGDDVRVGQEGAALVGIELRGEGADTLELAVGLDAVAPCRGG